MNENDPIDQPASHLLIRQILRQTQHDPKLAPQVLQALLPRLQAVVLEPSQQQLDSIRQECVVRLSLDETLEDLEIRRRDERLEDEHERDHVLVLPPGEPEGGSASREVVHGVGDRGLVWANASDLGTKGGVSRTTLGEGGSEEGDDVVTAGEDEESDDLFVSVDDEVAAKGGGLFVSGDELGGGEVSEVASVRLEREKRRKVSLGELEKQGLA
jgi:hypothetical protein